ncbi:hypothetical protein SAMN05428984_4356 [Sphingomonas sp. OK281]|jgi:hypothetical protein|nr:hypothetical protein SAMN05428984_4356 [Sphingomonas sp. OK281]
MLRWEPNAYAIKIFVVVQTALPRDNLAMLH